LISLKAQHQPRLGLSLQTPDGTAKFRFEFLLCFRRYCLTGFGIDEWHQ